MIRSTILAAALAAAVWASGGCADEATKQAGCSGQVVTAKAEAALTVTCAPWGKTADGTAVDLYTLTNGVMTVRVMTYGATLTAVETPDKAGQVANVTLYLDACDAYLAGHPNFGSVVGRFANRIGGAKFPLDGAEVVLPANAGPNHIHGGKIGFAKVVWKAEPVRGDRSVGVKMTYISRDGEEGYPGNLTASITYRLTADNALGMEYEAVTDKPTVVNLTNHAYWNLAGAGAGDVLDHVVVIPADRYLATDNARIPTGELLPVAGTPLDFRTPERVGARLANLPGGYDHCYVLNRRWPGELIPVARVKEPTSGRIMDVASTQPGVQLYTANGLDGKLGGGGRPYPKYAGLCLETQHYPNSPNRPEFPSTVLRPGETLRQVTVHRFSTEPAPKAAVAAK